MSKVLTPGQIVIIQGGKYDGQGAKFCKVDQEAGTVEVIIAGKVVRLKLERVQGNG